MLDQNYIFRPHKKFRILILFKFLNLVLNRIKVYYVFSVFSGPLYVISLRSGIKIKQKHKNKK